LKVNDHPHSGWLGLARLGRVSPPKAVKDEGAKCP